MGKMIYTLVFLLFMTRTCFSAPFTVAEQASPAPGILQSFMVKTNQIITAFRDFEIIGAVHQANRFNLIFDPGTEEMIGTDIIPTCFYQSMTSVRDLDTEFMFSQSAGIGIGIVQHETNDQSNPSDSGPIYPFPLDYKYGLGAFSLDGIMHFWTALAPNSDFLHVVVPAGAGITIKYWIIENGQEQQFAQRIGSGNFNDGQFHNLGFEEAGVASPGGTWVDASQAFPGWVIPAYCLSGFRTGALDSTCISLHDGQPAPGWHINPIEGNYSILLQSGENSDGTYPNASISQVGKVPEHTRSLLFSSDLGGDMIMVTLNGIEISTSLYSVGETKNSSWGPICTYIGDISMFAGMEDVELRFEVVRPSPTEATWATLDSIRFSEIVVPEPGTFIMLFSVLATGVLLPRRRRRISK